MFENKCGPNRVYSVRTTLDLVGVEGFEPTMCLSPSQIYSLLASANLHTRPYFVVITLFHVL